jgi:hypothetical protein
MSRCQDVLEVLRGGSKRRKREEGEIYKESRYAHRS